MFKRTWILWMVMLVMAALLSACGGSKLAENLTPIPTLPPGNEPELVAALQGQTATPETTAESGGAMSQDELVSTGKDIFSSTCAACHGEDDGAGPGFAGMAGRAATREAGKTAEEYLHESIVDPSAYVVDGFADIMPKEFADQFSDQELKALVAYIMADSGGGEAEATPESTIQVEPTEQATEEAAPTAEATEAAAPAGDPAAGEQLFEASCGACHGAEDGAGPALTGMGERAATRVDGMTAEEYLHESIVDPSAYVVDGFADIMPKGFADQFSDQELSDLVAYILTQ